MAKKKAVSLTKEDKSPSGGLTKKGRDKYNRETGSHLKAPQPEGGARKKSFCARMSCVNVADVASFAAPNRCPTMASRFMWTISSRCLNTQSWRLLRAISGCCALSATSVARTTRYSLSREGGSLPARPLTTRVWATALTETQ